MPVARVGDQLCAGEGARSRPAEPHVQEVPADRGGQQGPDGGESDGGHQGTVSHVQPPGDSESGDSEPGDSAPGAIRGQ